MVVAATALPDVQSAGLSDSTTVWILYKDGTSQIITTLPRTDETDVLTPAAAALRRQEQRAQVERIAQAALPTGRKAFLYSALDADYTKLQLNDPITTMQGWFTTQGYNVATDKLTLPQNLNSVTNASVFYLDTHGGIGITKDNEMVYGIATPVLATDAFIAIYKNLIDSNEMGYISVAEWQEELIGVPYIGFATYLYITPAFVRDKTNNMSFTANSVVFINGCGLMAANPEAQDMVKALHQAGATTVLGWDGVANVMQAADSGIFLMDRVLGSNGYIPYQVSPANRPFDVETVLLDMDVKDRQPALQPVGSTLTLSKSVFIKVFTWNATLTSDIAAGFDSSALAPTIATVSIQNDKNQLTVYGDFGGSYTNRSITIGGNEVDAIWSDNTITINPFAMSGPGSGGEILVTIDGAKSNQVLVQQWNAMQLTMFTINGTGSTGSQRTVNCTNINLRASFDTLRQDPDIAPIAGAVTVDDVVLQNGTCTYDAIGTPSGAGNIPWSNAAGATNTNFAVATGLAKADGIGGGTMSLQMQAAYLGMSDGSFVLDTSSTTSANLLQVNDSTQYIPAGVATQYSGPGIVLDTLGWSATAGSTTPVPNYAR